MTTTSLPIRVPVVGRGLRVLRSNRIVMRYFAAGRWRRTVPVVLAAIMALVLYERVVIEFMHDRRQDSLVSQFNAQATSSTVEFGDAVALLQIPSLGVNAVVGEGESHATLRGGPAHRLTSAMPGSNGNAVIAGKHSRYGAPFARLEQAAVGAEIFVKTRAGVPVRYTVDEVSVLPAGDDSAFQPASEGRLTLVTSKGWFTHEMVVVSALADPGSTLEEAGSVPFIGARSDDRVTATDFGIVGVWFTAAVLLLWLARRLPAGLSRVAKYAILAPVVLAICLEFMLAMERLLPATV